MVERDRLATRQSRRPHPRFRQPEATSPSPRYRNAAAMVTTGMVICLQVEADHRRHAVVEQSIAELKYAGSALLPRDAERPRRSRPTGNSLMPNSDSATRPPSPSHVDQRRRASGLTDHETHREHVRHRPAPHEDHPRPRIPSRRAGRGVQVHPSRAGPMASGQRAPPGRTRPRRRRSSTASSSNDPTNAANRQPPESSSSTGLRCSRSR
jgi:hypothetical protein